MKILLLTERFGDKIPTGVISKRIADELFNLGNDITVISSELIGEKWNHGQHYICKRKKLIPARILVWISNFIQANIDTFLWRCNMISIAGRVIRNTRPDIIYARSTPVSVCEIASKLKQKFGIKVVMHFTDPVPAPIEWDNNILYRKRMIKTMNRILPYADKVSFGNHAMMSYQQKIQSYFFVGKSFISHDPVPQQSLYYGEEDTNKTPIILTYLGSIYGNRNPNELFKAIERYNMTYRPMSLLIYDINRTHIPVPSFVHFVGRCDDVNKILLSSNILINLDGDDSEPVFISSKLKEYLCCGRKIISITPNDSPSRLITEKFKTVISVCNNKEEIYSALVAFLDVKFSESDYLERINTIEQFTPKKVAMDLLLQFRNILS